MHETQRTWNNFCIEELKKCGFSSISCISLSMKSPKITTFSKSFNNIREAPLRGASSIPNSLRSRPL